MTNNELVSRVINTLRSVDKDSRIPKRYVLKVATDKAIFLMAQKFRDRSLFREANLYQTVDCFELERIDTVKCPIVEFRTCNRVMKSKKKLPELIYFRYGSSLKEVTNVDFSLDFRASTPAQYRRNKKREKFRGGEDFYIRDGFLYIPDSHVEVVSLYLYTPNEYEAKKASACEEDKCLNPWDSEFVVSDKLREIVVQQTIQEISIRLGIPEDENPNMDSNIKSKTTN